MRKLIMVTIVLGLLGLSGCQMVKGAAGDLSWGFNKIDQAIVVPN